MASKLLFNKKEWYRVVEEQVASFKSAYEALPDDQALDDPYVQALKDKMMLHIPTLFRDKMEFEEIETDRHRLGKHNLAVRMASQGQSVTEFVFHIPFDGDATVFDIAPSASNGDVAQGEISGQTVLIRVQPLPGYDAKAHVDREVSKIEWRLTHLRGGLLHLDEQLTIARSWCIKARKEGIEARSKIIRDFGIPRRQPATPPTPAAPFEKPSPASKTTALETWDVFMSHASPDKPWVRGLVKALRAEGVTVWFDEDCLGWGGDLQRGINRGLVNSRKAIAVLSKAYLAERKWTEAEISGFLAREKLGEELILPIWHEITEEDLKHYNLILASRIAKVSESHNYDVLVSAVAKALGRDQGSVQSEDLVTSHSLVADPNLLGQTSRQTRLTLKSSDHLVLRIEQDESHDMRGFTLTVDNNRLDAIGQVAINTYSAQSFDSNHQAFRTGSSFNAARIIQSNVVQPGCSGRPALIVRKDPSKINLFAGDNTSNVMIWPENDKAQIERWRMVLDVVAHTAPSGTDKPVPLIAVKIDVIVTWDKGANEFFIEECSASTLCQTNEDRSRPSSFPANANVEIRPAARLIKGSSGLRRSDLELNPNEQELLYDATQDSSGRIFHKKAIGKDCLMVNGQMYPEGRDPRVRAEWFGALKSLEMKGLIEGVGSDQDYFAVTADGWKTSDMLSDFARWQTSEITLERRFMAGEPDILTIPCKKIVRLPAIFYPDRISIKVHQTLVVEAVGPKSGGGLTFEPTHAWFIDQSNGETIFFHLYQGARIESQRLILEINGPIA